MTAHVIRAAAEVGVLAKMRQPGTTEGRLVEQGLHPDALAVLLPLLQHLGVAESGTPKAWALTETAERVLSDHILTALGSQGLGTRIDEAGRSLASTFQHGGVAYEHEYGSDFWSDLSRSPIDEAAFHTHLEHTTLALVEPLLAAVDWSAARAVVDLGGGRGILARALVVKTPGLNATVVDRPSLGRFFVPASNHTCSENTGLCGGRECASAGSVQFHGADLFFDDLPPGDTYIAAQIIHDWPDGAASALLANVRRCMPPASRLLIIERSPTLASAYMSMRMFLLFGAKERSANEVCALAQTAGLRLVSVEPLGTDFAVFELATA